MTPSRRSVLKAAVAGGAFAVPLIASFSMDATASAQPGPQRQVVSNMFCSNQSFDAPTGFFVTEVAGSGPHGPLFGSVWLGFFGGLLAQMDYALEAPGFITAFRLFGTSVFGPANLFIENPGLFGTVRGSQVTCVNHLPPEAGLATLFELATDGKLTAFITLEGGTELSGTVTPVGPFGRFAAERRLRP